MSGDRVERKVASFTINITLSHSNLRCYCCCCCWCCFFLRIKKLLAFIQTSFLHRRLGLQVANTEPLSQTAQRQFSYINTYKYINFRTQVYISHTTATHVPITLYTIQWLLVFRNKNTQKFLKNLFDREVLITYLLLHLVWISCGCNYSWSPNSPRGCSLLKKRNSTFHREYGYTLLWENARL